MAPQWAVGKAEALHSASGGTEQGFSKFRALHLLGCAQQQQQPCLSEPTAADGQPPEKWASSLSQTK